MIAAWPQAMQKFQLLVGQQLGTLSPALAPSRILLPQSKLPHCFNRVTRYTINCNQRACIPANASGLDAYAWCGDPSMNRETPNFLLKPTCTLFPSFGNLVPSLFFRFPACLVFQALHSFNIRHTRDQPSCCGTSKADILLEHKTLNNQHFPLGESAFFHPNRKNTL